MKKLMVLLVVLVIGAVLGAGAVWQLSSRPELNEFTIGETTFIMRGWTSEERKELEQTIRDAYPILEEIYGEVPVNVRGEPIVETIIIKEATLDVPPDVNVCGVGFNILGSSVYFIGLESTGEGTVGHELAHAFFGPVSIRDAPLYHEGFADASETLVSQRLDRIFQSERASCRLPEDFEFTLTEGKPQLAGDWRIGVLRSAQRVLSQRLWLDVLDQDPQFIAKMRQRILGEYQKGVRTLNISEIAEEIFTGDWGEVKSSHPLLGDVPSGEQIVIVPAVRGDPRIKQLVAVAFVAGSSGGELIGEEIDVEVWLEGELDRSFTDTTNDQGFIQLATADELLEYGGCTLRFRVETDFGSDEVTFTPDPDELCATGGRFGVNGLHHFYKQNH